MTVWIMNQYSAAVSHAWVGVIETFSSLILLVEPEQFLVGVCISCSMAEPGFSNRGGAKDHVRAAHITSAGGRSAKALNYGQDSRPA